MTALLVILCVVLIAVIAVQIGRVTELAAKLRGEEEVEELANKRNANWLLVFLILFLGITAISGYAYKNYYLGYGPHESASAHGGSIDYLFDITLFFTGIVFIITQIALFYFGYKYRHRRGGQAMYLSHNNKLEVIWTAIPAVVMTFLVVGGLDVWNEVMADVPVDEDVIEIEATGYQFGWLLRYPGPDGKLGARNFRLTSGTNQLGQDWSDPKNHDDFFANDLVLPKGKTVRVRITAKDVLHDFYLPQFRVKMDAVPGLPTYFVFTPEKTTEEYRQELRKYAEYNVPDPNSPEQMLWETFQYELACAELCGKGHWSMRKLVNIVEPAEYERWLNEQQSTYLTEVRGTPEDPLAGQLTEVEITQRSQEFANALQGALEGQSDADRTVAVNYIAFAPNSSELPEMSMQVLQNLLDVLKQRPDLRIEIGGYTTAADQPDPALAQARADAIKRYLVAQGINANQVSTRGAVSTPAPADTTATDTTAAERYLDFRIMTEQQ